MHLPPAATWEVGAARWPRRVAALLLGLTGLQCAVFFCSQRWGTSSLILLLVLCLCLAVALRGLRCAAKGALRWDGAHWYWIDTQHHAVTQVLAVADGQLLMLLRIECCDGKRLWLWLESRAMDRHWLAMRRAVVASQQVPAPLQAPPLPDRNAQ